MTKEEIITEIKAIYRDHGYQSQGRSLEEFNQEQLEMHLRHLQAGAYPWMRVRPAKRSPHADLA